MFAWRPGCRIGHSDDIPAKPKGTQNRRAIARRFADARWRVQADRINGDGKYDDASGIGGVSRRKNREAAVNTMSLFGSAATPAGWIEIFLGLSALTMASASRLPGWQWQSRVARAASTWLPVGGLLGLAAASVIAGVMQPELFAAVFSEL
jgi:hypothetical protein